MSFDFDRILSESAGRSSTMIGPFPQASGVAATPLAPAVVQAGPAVPQCHQDEMATTTAGPLQHNGIQDVEASAAVGQNTTPPCFLPAPGIEIFRDEKGPVYVVPHAGTMAHTDVRTRHAPGLPMSRRQPEIPFVPFPTDALPQPVRAYVEESARSINCCPSLVALPMLSCLAATIGATRRLQLKPDWLVPAIIWSAVVGESGGAKSPALEKATKFVAEIENRLNCAYRDELARHTAQHDQWKRSLRTGRNSAVDASASQEPIAPKHRRLMVSDVTMESLAGILCDNPRGVLLCRDELAGFFGSFDRYAKSKGADEASFLSMHRGSPLTVDRKTGIPPHIHVPAAFVSISGTIQPQVLARAMGPDRRASGLLARFLVVCPPSRRREWSEWSVSEQSTQAMSVLFDRLFGTLSTEVDSEEPAPLTVELTLDAKAVYQQFYERNADRLETTQGDLAAAYSKLEEVPARLALIIHCVRQMAGEVIPSLIADADTMRAAVTLGEWFCRETGRVYGILGRDGVISDHQKLVDFIQRKGGRVTAREVQQGCRWLKNNGEARLALAELVVGGIGYWERQPSVDGRTLQELFVLNRDDKKESTL